jgi:hypothetical protein
MSEGTVNPTPPEHPSVRYERTDASFKGVFTVVVIAGVLGALFCVMVWLFFSRVQEEEALRKKSPFPLAGAQQAAAGPSTALPREPRLEQVDRLAGSDRPDGYSREVDRLRILDSYGPTDEEGFIHVPIEQAIGYLANEKKLPARPEPSAGQRRRAGGLVDGGEPNSGRLFREGPR